MKEVLTCDPKQQPTRGLMKALSEKHLAIFRRHIVDVIGVVFRQNPNADLP